MVLGGVAVALLSSQFAHDIHLANTGWSPHRQYLPFAIENKIPVAWNSGAFSPVAEVFQATLAPPSGHPQCPAKRTHSDQARQLPQRADTLGFCVWQCRAAKLEKLAIISCGLRSAPRKRL